MIKLETIPTDVPVLIAGPTASGKSALALEIAQTTGGVVINADALQVYDGWRILTARPSDEDLARAPHALYGHVPLSEPYSTGQWLRDVKPLLGGRQRPIIVGGTGLNFAALTDGLVEIPPTPPQVRQEADGLSLETLLADLDPATRDGLDQRNRARVQRAWEVQRATGRPMRDWQRDTPPPLLPLSSSYPIVITPEVEWLNHRIEQRFDQMLHLGALDEARAILPRWDPKHLSSRAIGATELIDHLRGTLGLEQARTSAVIASRQYAKRQRTWFRSKMRDWRVIHRPSTE